MPSSLGPWSRRVPALLLVAGLLLVVAGFLYDVLFAGIPYQDPTPELQARYLASQAFAAKLSWTGAVTLGAGFLAWIAHRVLGR
jgi:hypothetical protein